VEVQFHAAGRKSSFEAEIDAENRRVRFERSITAAQARLGTGIVTINYPGNERTRPQEVRLRAASRPADLRLSRPSISDGRLEAAGTVAERARGVVQILIEYQADGGLQTHSARARIDDGAWELDERLPADVRRGIERREGTVHSYVAFTGYLPARVRGEFESFQVDVAG
jgi:hypothetical protein